MGLGWSVSSTIFRPTPPHSTTKLGLIAASQDFSCNLLKKPVCTTTFLSLR
jgi:hypothetical protein